MKSPDILQHLNQPLERENNGAANLMAREGNVRDIPEWQALHHSLGIPYAKTEWDALPRMWEELFRAGRLKVFLVEDRIKSCGTRIVTCCGAVFVTNEFCARARSAKSPFLGLELVRGYLSGNLPILTRAEAARAHAGEGLNIVLCFAGPERSLLSGQGYLPLCEKRSEAFHLAMAGYQIKVFLANPVGELAYEEMIEGGARLRWESASPPKAPRAGLRARVVGLTREEAEAHPGSHLAGLFVYTRPRFHFARSEQHLLQHALTGETCDDLAASLSLSPWTVKKRWHTIYERVVRADHALLPAPILNGARPHSRGAERRRRLLNYLRQHPEELRPAPLAQKV
jgi:hypothetical protein